MRLPEPAHGGYDAFFSHASRLSPDVEELVDAVAAALERRGFAIFLDRRRLRGGEPLLATLDDAIGRSRVGIVFVTPRAVASGWVEYELEAMARARRQGRMVLYALRLDAETALPPGISGDEVVVAESRRDPARLADQLALLIRAAPRSG